LTFGAGLLVGRRAGALGAAESRAATILVRGADVATVAWTEEVLNELAVSALSGYLAVAHYGADAAIWRRS